MTNIDQIYIQYFSDVYKYLLVLSKNETLSEELTQETFFKALKSIKKFKGECSIYSWLCQIAKNTYLSYVKKEKRLESYDDFEHIIYENDVLDEKLEQKETAVEIHKALHNLEEPYKEVFYLKTFGELPYCQIAQLFNKTESWARVTYHRAKIKLKEKIL